MTLTVNGKEKEYSGKLHLRNLVEDLKLETDRNGIAVCLNMQVIPKEEWDSAELKDGDKIEIVIAAPGG